MASAPDQVRGFGPVKMKALDIFDRDWAALLTRFNAPALPPAPVRELEQA
jgi:hypothetical protein